MECPSCGATVVANQKFCAECGADLKGVTDRTEEVEAITAETPPPAAAAIAADAATDVADDVADEPTDEESAATEQIDAIEADETDATADETDTTADETEEDAAEDATVDDVAEAAPSIADLPTQEITPRAPLPEPEWDPTQSPTEPIAVGVAAATVETATIDSPPPAATEQLEQQAPPLGPPVRSGTTQQLPTVFDGIEDVDEYPEAREAFKLRLVFVVAVFAAIATLMAAVADVSDIRTTRPVAGIDTGINTLDDVATNLGIAGWLGAAVMVIGALLACFGLRVGAGLAGGAGLSLLGWSALSIGLVEVPIARAESVTRTSSEAFTLTVTRDLGWWLIAVVGILGLLVFFASLRLIATGGHRPLNPWVAALGALGMVIAAAGPLVPVGDATFTDNFRSPTVAIDLPTAYFTGRLGQVLLIAVTGIAGFLIIRAYGLGLAAGGLAVATWLWISSLAEIGDRPVGIGDRNPGSTTTEPHGVTNLGMGLSLALLLIAAVLAGWMRQRERPRG